MHNQQQQNKNRADFLAAADEPHSLFDSSAHNQDDNLGNTLQS